MKSVAYNSKGNNTDQLVFAIDYLDVIMWLILPFLSINVDFLNQIRYFWK